MQRVGVGVGGAEGGTSVSSVAWEVQQSLTPPP